MYYMTFCLIMQECARIITVMNMNDYLKWRGDLSFKADPFNEVDNLCIAQIVYLNFDGILNSDSRMSIKKLAELYFEKYPELEDGKDFTRTRSYVLKLMAASSRFASCTVRNYVHIRHDENEIIEQFAAMIVDLNDSTSVVAFRGTDSTLTGWKEDMMLSYTGIASQDDAVDYINKYCTLLGKYRIIGHSKGGYLALYASMNCKWYIRHRIIEIYSDDGPGLRPGTYTPDQYEKIKHKYKLIVPEKDCIGTIYEIATIRKICKISVSNVFAAHYMGNWEVERNHLVESDRDAYVTNLSHKAIRQFLKETTPYQRKVFVNELFKAMDEVEIKSFSQFISGGAPLFIKALRRLSEMDGEAKEIAGKMISAFSDKIGSDIHKSINEGAGVIKERFFSNTKNKPE